MPTSNTSDQVVYTNKARCRDCYRCVRVCPVKAIRMHEGQASVDAGRCIACGTCIRECPQGAKSFRDDLDLAARLIREHTSVACSVAPSFAAALPAWQQRRLPSALRRLGFRYVGETAVGAYHVATATAEHVARQPLRNHVCTACPAVVRYIERYRPQLTPALVPVVSPMIAHARHLRTKLGDDVRVVFIGPCVAKKAEAQREEFRGLVNCVLTFQELQQWLDREGIKLSACEESDFDETPEGDSRLFPLEGGCVRTAGWSTDVLDGDVAAVSGFEEVREVLDTLKTTASPLVIEPLFCPQGCINGPAMPQTGNGFIRRHEVLDYAERHDGRVPDATPRPSLVTNFSPYRNGSPREYSEEEIRHVLEKTGKANKENQLNCGACGYPNCREKAIAVLEGLAELEMCMPYMKRLAEQRVDRIIETSPNGIVILDEHLQILSMNPAFRRYFKCTDTVCGRPISYLIDPEAFERLAAGQSPMIEGTVEHEKYGVVCHQILYPLPEERQYVGIFVNVTNTQTNERKLDELRAQTVLQARELLQQQVQMAETIATCLGENTAQGEALLDKLMLLAEERGEADNRRDSSSRDGTRWLRDTYGAK